MGKRKRKIIGVEPSRMKTNWETVKMFDVEVLDNKGLWLRGKALNGKRIIKHISSVHLKAMLCDDVI